MLEVKESNIEGAGLGVFATKDIDKDILLTEYYGTILSLEDIQEYDINALEPSAVLLWANFYTFGDVHKYKPNSCGQMINDYSIIQNRLYTDIELDDVVALYDKTSLKHCNVKPRAYNSKHYMLSSRFIKKGEELYFHYGSAYWLQNLDPAYHTDKMNNMFRTMNEEQHFAAALSSAVHQFKKQQEQST